MDDIIPKDVMKKVRKFTALGGYGGIIYTHPAIMQDLHESGCVSYNEETELWDFTETFEMFIEKPWRD